MLKKWLCLLLLPCTLYGNALCLKDKFAQAEPGSYLVTEQNRTYTLLHVYEKNAENMVLEEVTVPAARYQQNPVGWKTWLESGAPGHASWTHMQINLQSGAFEEVFSFTHQGWLDLSASDTFLTTLLNIPFQEVAPADRRRIGLPPGYNKPDHRKVWQPRLIVNGHPLGGVTFQAWKARWPSDGTELSRKIIEIYLPEERSTAGYPTYFPYWVEVEGKIGSAKVRVVDSGKGLSSPKPRLPHRAPHYVGEAMQRDGTLEIQLKAPAYFQDYLVLAEEDGLLGKWIPLPSKTTVQEGRTLLQISAQTLQENCDPGTSYHFIISPKEEPQICIESPNSFTYQQFQR